MTKSKAIQKWIDQRPPNVRRVANRLRPGTCYFSFNANGYRGHYLIRSYEENKDDSVTVTISHLDDSFLPGFEVFGVNPKDLKRCGCLVKKKGA